MFSAGLVQERIRISVHDSQSNIARQSENTIIWSPIRILAFIQSLKAAIAYEFCLRKTPCCILPYACSSGILSWDEVSPEVQVCGSENYKQGKDAGRETTNPVSSQ
jgi:hypothetical protein